MKRPSNYHPAPPANLSLNSDPACNAFRSLSAFRYLGFVRRLGAGVVGWLHSLGILTNIPISQGTVMALLDLWNSSTNQLKGKQLSQLIAVAGDGKLLDDCDCSKEFRSFLASINSTALSEYAIQCLTPFPDSGFALQDLVNEIGTRLGAKVSSGRYRGTSKHIGNDGLWVFPSGHAIIVEVKTTDAYRIDMNTLAQYRRELVGKGIVFEATSSILLIVGRQDTGDLEAQIRGSKHAWDIRIISVDALLRLMKIKEEIEDPQIVQRIHNILIPREFTRLDAIAEVLFSAAEDIKQETVAPLANESDEPVSKIETSNKEPKFAPVAFTDQCIARIQAFLNRTLIKRSRAGYSTPDSTIAVNCSISKIHDPENKPNYWFAFHPHQRDFLKQHESAYVSFGCGSSEKLLLIPFPTFESWLPSLWTTEGEDRMYWHVVIFEADGQYSLRRKKGEDPISLVKFILPKNV